MVWQLDQRGKQAWVAAPDVFDNEELDRICALWSVNKSPATIGVDKAIVPEVRSGTVQWVLPSKETEWLFDAIESAVYHVNQYFGLMLTEIQDLQLTEYDAAVEGHYGAHVDRDYGHIRDTHRKLSMTVQLTNPDEYDGGELLLYPTSLSSVSIPKQRGMTAFFRSGMIHEVKAGDCLPMHTHNEATSHIIIVAKGRVMVRVTMEDGSIENSIQECGVVLDTYAGFPHEVISLEDNARTVHITKRMTNGSN
jgi:PKHD-type hydroxylase